MYVLKAHFKYGKTAFYNEKSPSLFVDTKKEAQKYKTKKAAKRDVMNTETICHA